MAAGTKYFMLNRREDFEENSVIKNLCFKDDMLVSQNVNGENGVYISSAFDSLQLETVWHRLRIQADIPQNLTIRLKVYSSDSLYAQIPDLMVHGDKEVLLDDYLLNDKYKEDKKIALFDFLGAKTYENPSDITLFGFKGRYLWICMEIVNYSDSIAKIESIKIEFPRVSFVDYLPQIYRGRIDKNFFLARFVAIFQSIYVDLEDEIDNIPKMFDPKTVDPEFLKWLVEWFSIKDSCMWNENKLRIVLKNIVNLYKTKGTKQAISKIVELYIGEIPIIVEQFDVTNNDFYEKNKECVENLFGPNGYTFNVIIKTDKTITSDMYIELLRLINNFKPINAVSNLVILNDEIYLDHHCYLGMNSFVAKNESVILDDDSFAQNTLYLTDV